MKRIVVVVSSTDKKTFTGEDLDVIDTDLSSTVTKLVVREKKKQIAVFQQWRYWYQSEDKTVEDEDDEIYAGWKADTNQLITKAKLLMKMTDRKKALKALTEARKVIEELEKKYGY